MLLSKAAVICGPPFVASNELAESSEQRDTCGSDWTGEAAASEVARKLEGEFGSSDMGQVVLVDSRRKDLVGIQSRDRVVGRQQERRHRRLRASDLAAGGIRCDRAAANKPNSAGSYSVWLDLCDACAFRHSVSYDTCLRFAWKVIVYPHIVFPRSRQYSWRLWESHLHLRCASLACCR